MKVAAGNAQHIGARQEQQDSFGFSDPQNEAFVSHGGLLGVVADGMGGLSHGSEASQAAVRAFLLTYESKVPDESIPDALARSLTAANEAVLALADRLDSRNGTGTTLAAAVLHGDSLHWISAGDSRVYLCHGNSLTRVTSDHVLARRLNEEVARGTISRAEAQENAERAALTSYLGDLKEIDRNLRPFVLRNGDRVFLCSDGLYRALSEAEVTEAFRSDPQTACDMLIEQAVAKQRKHQDNLTIIALANGTSLSPAHAILSKAVLLFAGLLVLAAIAAGMYARSWWKNRQGEPRAALQSRRSATGATSGATKPVPPAPPTGASTPSAAQAPAGDPAPQTKHGRGNSTQREASTSPHAGRTREGPVRGKTGSPGKLTSLPPTNATDAGEGQGSQGQAGQSQPARGQTGQAQSGAGSAAQSTSSRQPPTSSGQQPIGSGQPSGGQGTTPGRTAPSTSNGSATAPSTPPPTDGNAAQKPPAGTTPSPAPPDADKEQKPAPEPPPGPNLPPIGLEAPPGRGGTR